VVGARVKTDQSVLDGGDRDLSPRQVAEAIGVSESSLKRWCDSGLIPTRRTAGGHRRVPVAGVVAFLRERGFDPYTLPVAVAELVLRDTGWNATSLGSGNPAASLCAAIDDLSPRLVCVSASAISDAATFTADCNELYEHARSRGTALALGGRAITRELREGIRYSVFCQSMSALVGFAESLWTRG
jgi:excisionase family DNA binding protein